MRSSRGTEDNKDVAIRHIPVSFNILSKYLNKIRLNGSSQKQTIHFQTFGQINLALGQSFQNSGQLKVYY